MGTESDKDKGILLQVATNEVEFLLFQLSDQYYAINVAKVCQILLYDPTTISYLPKQSPELIGLTTFREKAISVVDLRIHLNKPRIPTDQRPALLLVTEFNRRITGFIIDSVERIERCSWKDFEPITDTVCDKTHGSVVGTVRLKEGLVVILDLETIMAKLDPSTSIEAYKEQIPVSSINRGELSIVYCEDSIVVQKLLLQTLTEAGFRGIKTFKTGAEGFEYLEKTPGNKVDLILSDIEMPQMDGLTLCKKTRNLPGYENVPFFFFSSTINPQMETKCRSVGADACFSKPQVHEVIAEIEKVFVEKGSR